MLDAAREWVGRRPVAVELRLSARARRSRAAAAIHSLEAVVEGHLPASRLVVLEQEEAELGDVIVVPTSGAILTGSVALQDLDDFSGVSVQARSLACPSRR